MPQERLKSRRPFVPAVRKLLNDLFELGIRALSGRIIDRAQSILNAHPYSMYLFLRPVPGPLKLAYPEYLEFRSIACGLALSVFIRPYTNGVQIPPQIASVVR